MPVVPSIHHVEDPVGAVAEHHHGLIREIHAHHRFADRQDGDFRLGFRVEPRINLMFRKVVEDLVRNFEVDITSRYESLGRKNLIGDFRFVVMEKFLSYDNELPFYEKIIMDIYFFFKGISLSEERAFGLDTSSVTIEKVPMVVSAVREVNLKRVK